MALFHPKTGVYTNEIDADGDRVVCLPKTAFNEFDATILGLGDLSTPSTATDAIAGVFDLEGFTHFCKQIEPHLSVPLFLTGFLPWLMEQLKSEMKHGQKKGTITLWSPLPFCVKYLGDGLLVLWDVSDQDHVVRRNIIISAHAICANYSAKFYPKLRSLVTEPPLRLRCGLARGTVYSVGDGNDFVGSCINMAARLQKLPGITFAFNRRGFNLEEKSVADWFKTEIEVREVSIRGIGDHELVGFLRHELSEMSDTDRKAYRSV